MLLEKRPPEEVGSCLRRKKDIIVDDGGFWYEKESEREREREGVKVVKLSVLMLLVCEFRAQMLSSGDYGSESGC